MAGVVFGIVAISTPNMPMKTLQTLFAGYVLVDGALAAYGANLTHGRRSLLIQSIVDVTAGLGALLMPGATALRIIGGARSVVVGGCEATTTLRPSASEVHWLSGFGGIAAILTGALLLAWPGSGEIALPWLLGLSAWLSGILFTGGAVIDLARDAPQVRRSSPHSSETIS